MKKILLSLLILLLMNNLYAQTVPYYTGSHLSSSDGQAILNHHNQARHYVGVPPLIWSTKLANYAQSWADYLSVHNNCTMKHSKCKDNEGNALGENLWWGIPSTAFKPIDASIGWLTEIKDYHYEKYGNHTGNQIGHYTQMIWKSTKEMGVGVAYCSDGGMLVVASYSPPGNWIGEFPY